MLQAHLLFLAPTIVTHDGVSRETREGAPTLNLVAVAQMTRTGEPETVSLTVNGPTRINGQQTKPTPRAGSGAGATGRTKQMQEQKNNTTNVKREGR